MTAFLTIYFGVIGVLLIAALVLVVSASVMLHNLGADDDHPR